MFLLLFFCTLLGVKGDEQYDWDKEISESGAIYDISLHGEPKLLISKNMSLVEEVVNMESNNNVASIMFQGRLFIAWRTAPVHFASADTRLHLASSEDLVDWTWEQTYFLGSDLREPLFVEAEGNLFFYFFQGGTNPTDFEPLGLFSSQRSEIGVWTEPQLFGHEGEVIWEIVKENGTLYSQSYSGDYSTPGDAQDLGKLQLFFNRSENGVDWSPVETDSVYTGGLTEVGFAFDLAGNLWGVGRNEDGDESGWGSRSFFAPHTNLSDWRFFSNESDQIIYESPKMFRHGSEFYLVARTDPDGPFWSKDNPVLNILPAWEHHLYDLVSFSLRQHGTGIWKLDQETGELNQVLDLVGCGDTAFPSIIRWSKNMYMILNYSSTIDDNCPPNWIMGQVSPSGSVIYAQFIEFLIQE